MDPEAKRSDWKRRDVWLGALFVSVGVMSTLFAILAFDHDVPSFFWWTCAWGSRRLLDCPPDQPMQRPVFGRR
jgi:hypothetical protein